MQNFNQLFPKNTNQDSPKTIRLLQGELTLFKRPKSQQWQCRFKLPNGQWHAASTAAEDLDSAKTQAVAIYETVKIKIGAGLAVTTKTFKQVALDEIANMAQAKDNKAGKRTYRDYTFAINKYLIPFFGQYEISQITNELLVDFESWRIAEMGRIPMASTKRNHASAYIRVINLARDRGYIAVNKAVPLLDSKGKKSQPRPAFTAEEIKELLSYTETWQKSSYTDRTALMRTLCSFYI